MMKYIFAFILATIFLTGAALAKPLRSITRVVSVRAVGPRPVLTSFSSSFTMRRAEAHRLGRP
jgi:hypothetical protein